MTEDKGKKEPMGFFDDESDDEYLSEKTVVDSEILKKLNEKLKQEEEKKQDISESAELLDEVVVPKGATLTGIPAQRPTQQGIRRPTMPPVPPAPPRAMPTPPAMPAQPPRPPAPLAPPVAAAPPVPPAPPVQAAPPRPPVPQVPAQPAPPAPLPFTGDDDEKTVILATDSLGDGMDAVKGKLIVTGGPEKGKEFTIDYNEVYVGRGVENDVVIADRSISRKHFRVRRHLGEYIASDLGSGNGTMVNGKRITEHPLVTGEIITIGKTVLRFEMSGQENQAQAPAQPAAPAQPSAPPAPPIQAPPAPAAPVKPVPQAAPPQPVAPAKPAPQPPAQPPAPPAPAPQAKPAAPAQPKPAPVQSAGRPVEEKSGGIGGGTIFVILLVAVVVIGGVMFKDRIFGPAEEPQVEQPAQDVERTAKITKLLQDAKAFRESRFFDKAQAAYAEVLTLDTENTEAIQGKVAAQRESLNQTTFNEGKAAFEKDDVAGAKEKLSGIAQESVFYPEARAILDKIAALEAKMQQAQAAPEPPAEEAPAQAEPDPEPTPAPAAPPAAQEEEEPAPRAAAAPREERRQNRRERRQARREEPREAPREEPRSAPPADNRRQVSGASDLNSGLGLYKNGNADGAIRELNTIAEGRGHSATIAKAKKLVGNIRKFKSAFEAGKQGTAAGKPAKSIPKLKSALKLDRDIASGSKYQAQVLKYLSESYVHLGKSLQDKGSYGKAFKAYQLAQKADGSNSKAKAGLKEIAKQARTLYYEGLTNRDSNPDVARKKWNEVMSITASSNKWHKKAKDALGQL